MYWRKVHAHGESFFEYLNGSDDIWTYVFNRLIANESYVWIACPIVRTSPVFNNSGDIPQF